MRSLVVGEERPLLRALQTCLREGGFQVDLAWENDDAKYKGGSIGYDLILLSLARAGEQGFSLLRTWRRGGISCPILVLSAAGSVAERVQSLDLGADDYLSRPFQCEDLLARVRALVRRTYRVPDAVLRVHDLEIDTSARTVKRAGRSIFLTPREFALLQFLAFHRGRVVTRSMIWEHIYDEHDETVSNVIEVYIRYLRHKIDKGFEPRLILTRWGQGYMLRGDDE
jgi:DNA-binding response OmpR family regulator